MKIVFIFFSLFLFVFGQTSTSAATTAASSSTVAQTTAPPTCQSLGTCTACSAAGCAYCIAYSSTAEGGCFPPNATAQTLSCNGMDNQGNYDEFIAPGNPTTCFGGCQTGSEDCPTCTNLGGCGWCYSAKQCYALTSSSSCGASLATTCVVPCNARINCQGCFAPGANCTWVPSSLASPFDGVCVTYGTPENKTITSTSQCPNLPPPGTAGNLSIFIPLLLALLAFVSWKKTIFFYLLTFKSPHIFA